MDLRCETVEEGGWLGTGRAVRHFGEKYEDEESEVGGLMLICWFLL